MTKIFEALMILAWTLIALVTDHYLPWLSWHGEALAVLALIFGYFAYLFKFPRGQRQSGLPVSTAVILLLFAVAVIQALYGKLLYPIDLMIFGVYVVLYCISCYLGYELMSQNEISKHKILTYGATLFGLFGLILAAEAFSRTMDAGYLSELVAGIGAVRRPGSNLSQPNHLATMLGWASVALLYLYLTKEIGPKIALISGLIIMAALAITESRTGFASSMLIIFLLFATKVLTRRKDKIVIIAVFLGYALLFFAWPKVWSMLHLFDLTNSTVNVTTSGRIQLWKETIAAIWKSPITGWGYRQFALAHMTVITAESGALIATYAHNLILDVAIWFGIPIALLLALTSISWLKREIKSKGGMQKILIVIFLVPLLTHSLLEYPYAYTYFLIPTAFAIGAIEGQGLKERIFRNRNIVTVPLVAIFFLTATVMAYEYFRLEEDLRLARFASARVGSDPVGHQDFNPMLLRQIGELVTVARYKPHCNMEGDDIEQLYRVSRYYPWMATLGKYAAAAKLNNLTTEYYDTIRIVESYFGKGAVYKIEERIKDYELACKNG